MTVTDHTQGNPQSLVDILARGLRYSCESWYDKGGREGMEGSEGGREGRKGWRGEGEREKRGKDRERDSERGHWERNNGKERGRKSEVGRRKREVKQGQTQADIDRSRREEITRREHC